MGCRAVDGTFVLQEWRQMKKEGFSTTVIADAQTGAAVGFIDCRDSEPVYLSLFLLDAALQGKGLGTELYRAQLRDEGKSDLSSSVSKQKK